MYFVIFFGFVQQKVVKVVIFCAWQPKKKIYIYVKNHINFSLFTFSSCNFHFYSILFFTRIPLLLEVCTFISLRTIKTHEKVTKQATDLCRAIYAT